MDPAVRLLRLLSLLPARPWWSGPELAARLEVSARTLRRDVTRLRELGYPVSATGGREGGYRLGAGGRLPPLLLDDDEAVATTIGLQLAAVAGVGGGTSAVGALGKLDQVLPPRLRERVRALQHSTVQLPDPARPAVDPSVLTTLASGCRDGEGLRFTYESYAGAISERSVEPYQIVHSGRWWYLAARDRDREAWRTFRIDRITAVSGTGQRYRLVDPPDAVALVLEGTRLAVRTYEARILLELSYEQAQRAFPPMYGVVIESAPGGRTILRVGADDIGSLVTYAAGLSYDFEVLDPPELRTELRRRALAIAEHHT